MTAHPNITITDASMTVEDIERFYSKEHARVWELVRTVRRAADLPPPIFEVVSLSACCGNQTAQAKGRRPVESGWLDLFPEEEAALQRELPEEASSLEVMASGPVVIESASVIKAPNARTGPFGVTELIRTMKDERLGRPSTYASHVEAMFECVDLGWLSVDDANRFRVAAAGRILLDVLADPSLPRLDKAYTALLEADLDAIERGERSPAQALARHLGRLPGVKVDIPADALDTISESAQPGVPKGGHIQAGAPIHVSLPAEIDPENVLASSHPLRVVRSVFDTVIKDAFGQAQPNRAEAGRRRACRAVALARIIGDLPVEAMVERLQLDLGWRWVVGLSPSDPVWSVEVLRGLVVGAEAELVERLVGAAEESVKGLARDGGMSGSDGARDRSRSLRRTGTFPL